MEEEFVGAIKIKDGLFIGDEYAAQDFEFIVTNKVTHIINCAGKQIPNYWETVGVNYLTYDWMDSENQVVFDVRGEVVNEIFAFIEEAVKLGEGVLVHSLKGQSRSCCVLTAYFMKRYHWSLYKTLEFLTSRRADLEIRTSFYHQLLSLESRLFQQVEHKVTHNCIEPGHEHDHEEHLLRNTFLNARSAPFDEALINPQPVSTRARKIDWVDEKNTKAVVHQYFSKETVAARLAKPVTPHVKSILKGSNKVFKYHKSKTLGDEVSSSAGLPKTTNQPGLRVHKSVRNLSEVPENQGSTMLKSGSTSNLTNERSSSKPGSAGNSQSNKESRSSSMLRSSSAVYLDREDATKNPMSKSAIVENDKTNSKFNNINGNIIHVTVNNYLAPVNNVNAVNQPTEYSSVKEKRSTPIESTSLKPNAQKFTIDRNSKDANYDSAKVVYSDSNYRSGPTPSVTEKSTLSTNQLKSAIEKKLSKDYKNQFPSSGTKGETQPIMVKHSLNERSVNEVKTVKVTKDMNKPAELKPNYQVLLKNRETPPPRKREEAKRINESPLKKPGSASLSKSAVAGSKTNTVPGDSTMPYSSYLNTLFSSSFSQINTVTPSAYASNQPDKKTPQSNKAVPVTYSLNLSQKAQTLSRPQRVGSSQSNERGYNSNMGSSMQKAKVLYASDIPVAVTTNTSKLTNNYVAPTKNIPVKVNYEKIERPSSASVIQARSITPQTNLRRTPGNSTSGYDSKSVNITDSRSSIPSKVTKHNKKQSEGSTQELLAKYRQRSTSPGTYNSALSSSAMAMRSKLKY